MVLTFYTSTPCKIVVRIPQAHTHIRAPMPPSRYPPPHIITLHIFFVHYGFGLDACYYVKVVLSLRFLFHVCGVFGFILYVGLFFFLMRGCVRGECVD